MYGKLAESNSSRSNKLSRHVKWDDDDSDEG